MLLTACSILSTSLQVLDTSVEARVLSVATCELCDMMRRPGPAQGSSRHAFMKHTYAFQHVVRLELGTQVGKPAACRKRPPTGTFPEAQSAYVYQAHIPIQIVCECVCVWVWVWEAMHPSSFGTYEWWVTRSSSAAGHLQLI